MENKQHGGARPGAGRKPTGKRSTVQPIRFDADIWERFPEPRAKYVKEAAIEKAKKEGLIE